MVVYRKQWKGLINISVFGIKCESFPLQKYKNTSFTVLTRAIRLLLLKVNIFNLANQNSFHMHLPKFRETSLKRHLKYYY